MPIIINGTAISAAIRAEIAMGVAKLKAERGIVPGLATVLVGEDPASHAYVKSKHKACLEVGMASFGYELPKETTQDDLLRLVHDLAARDDVHGILVQMPLPKQINEDAVINAIPVHKDVDGFHPANLGLLGVKGKEAKFEACTPQGCIELIQRSGIEIAGKRAAVLGRSTIVGLPVALMLLRRDATVTICHSRTPNLAEVTREADILIAAIGKAKFVTAEMVKPGATVIDVGINRIADPSAKKGSRLVGDVDYDAVSAVAGAITPVPGGVGPMTIAMLLKNTLRGASTDGKRISG
jgi:5,10-methylene-tetrahydrofolate dehydrogenase/methenyl tetrahydrofolate cyclohydrolase